MKKPLIPGNVLKDLLEEYQIHITQLATDIGLSVSAVRQIVANKAKISFHIAKRLSKYFNTTVMYWIDLQNEYDRVELEKDQKLSEIIKAIPKAKKPSPAKEKKTTERKERKGAAKNDAVKTRKPRRKKVKEEVAEAE